MRGLSLSTMLRLITTPLLALIWMMLTADVRAQSTFASLTGIVVGPGGAVITGASIEALHLPTGYRYSTTSNEVGYYTFPELREGNYEIRVNKDGFQESVVTEVHLAARQVRRLDLEMVVGSVLTKVEVRAGAAEIETVTPNIGATKEGETLRRLPFMISSSGATRSLLATQLLEPGVTQTGGGTSTRRYSGSRRNQSDATLDGISFSNLDSAGAQINTLVGYMESFQEVRTDTAGNSADIGATGQITVISKAGTNQFHGSFYDYYQSPSFRARNPFALERAPGINHFLGGSIGGPVLLPRLYHGRDRTFFFFSYETQRGSATVQNLSPTVPIPGWRAGNFGTLAIRDPFANNAPFPNNTIPAARLNPVSLKLQERFYPLPNFGSIATLQSQNYRQTIARKFDPDYFYTTRIDQRISDKSLLFARWTFRWNQKYGLAGGLPTIGEEYDVRTNAGLAVSYTHIFRPNLLNEIRGGGSYDNEPVHGPVNGLDLVNELGLQGLAPDIPDIPGMPNISFSGVSIQGLSQTNWKDPGARVFNQQYQDQLTWIHGRHTVKTGLVLTRVSYSNWAASSNLFGGLTFSNRFAGHPYADFLLGIPTTAARAFAPLPTYQFRYANDTFVTDEFKVTRKLTLTLGARYELHPAWRESHNRLSVFNPATGGIVVPDAALSQVSSLLPRGYVSVNGASQAGLPGNLINTDRNNIAPRLGLAYRLTGNTVLRAGFGVFFDISPQAPTVGGVPFQIAEPNYTNPTANPTVILPVAFPASVAGPDTIALPSAFDPDLRTPYTLQTNVSIERQQWNTGFRISYIGTGTRQGVWSQNINQPLPGPGLYINKPRAYTNYPAIAYLTNGAGHQYHSLNVVAQRRWRSGLYYQFSWVWARDIGDLEQATAPENAYDRRRERMVWIDIPTHRVAANFDYELPFGRGKRFLSSAGSTANAIVSGWEITGIYSFLSGNFLTPTWTGPDPTGTAYTASATPAQVTIRPDILFDPNLPSGQRTTQRWLDIGAFAAPASGRFGTSAGGVIKGPPVNVWNLALVKAIWLKERVKMRLEMHAANVFNHPNWSNPGIRINTVGNGGVISGVGGVSNLEPEGARTLRAGIRLEW